ncbi:MAG: hypothetical protein KA715_03100 [Xanthomonadaceae bacterium]|nr:hypothetical protein [Xanthomonadaceae bacterium]
MSKVVGVFAFLAALYLSTPNSNAAGMFHFGMQLGPSFPAGSSMGMAFGITSTYRIKPFLALGINYFTTGVGAPPSPPQTDLHQLMHHRRAMEDPILEVKPISSWVATTIKSCCWYENRDGGNHIYWINNHCKWYNSV